MMSDDALFWTAPSPPPRQPRPALRLWSMQKSGKRVDADLREHDGWGWECQFLYEGELRYGRRWVTRDEAMGEAEAKRVELTARGWQEIEAAGAPSSG